MTTLHFEAQHRLAILCELLPGAPSYEESSGVLETLMNGWGERPVSQAPFESHIGDDHTPFEFSIALGQDGKSELRLLVEAQASQERPTLKDTGQAGLELQKELEEHYHLATARLELIRDLFLPDGPKGAFCIWHAACLWKERRPEFKLYLNPQCHGASQARDVVAEALRRLGMGDQVSELWAQGGRRGPELDEVRYFSLDLSPSPQARVKVYYRHHDARAGDIEQAFAWAPHNQPGDATRFLDHMCAGHQVFSEKPLGSCFSFVQGNPRPLGATLHLPIAQYSPDDEVTARRVASWLEPGRTREGWESMLRAFATRRLSDGSGIQSYTSFRREATGLRTTIYLSPELYRPAMFQSNNHGSERRLIVRAKPNIRPSHTKTGS